MLLKDMHLRPAETNTTTISTTVPLRVVDDVLCDLFRISNLNRIPKGLASTVVKFRKRVLEYTVLCTTYQNESVKKELLEYILSMLIYLEWGDEEMDEDVIYDRAEYYLGKMIEQISESFHFEVINPTGYEVYEFHHRRGIMIANCIGDYRIYKYHGRV